MPPMLPVRTAVAPIRPSALCLFVAAFFLATAGVAAERTLTLDPEASTATFVLEATAHQVHGRLDVPAASITFDDATGEAAGTLRLDARRVTTDHTKRDAKMHREVLKSEDHPSILFEVERLKGEPWRGTPGANSTVDAVLVGTVTLAGSRHPLEIPLQVSVEGERLRAEGTFVVPYVAWGLEDPSVLFLRVAKEVEVSLEIEGRLGEPAA